MSQPHRRQIHLVSGKLIFKQRISRGIVRDSRRGRDRRRGSVGAGIGEGDQ